MFNFSPLRNDFSLQKYDISAGKMFTLRMPAMKFSPCSITIFSFSGLILFFPLPI